MPRRDGFATPVVRPRRRLVRSVRGTARRSLARLKHRGRTRCCPVCRAHLSRFLPHGLDHPVLTKLDVIGGGRRDEGLCPVCFATDRERLVYLYLREHTSLLSSEAWVLHVAPEPSLSRVFQRCKRLRYITADLQAPDVMLKLDITNIDLPDASFHVIVCNDVFEHVEQDRLAMAEMYRVLAPGGYAIVQTPVSMVLRETFEDPIFETPEERAMAYGQWDHVRVYARDYLARLTSVGFEVERFDWTSSKRIAPLGVASGLNPRETLYIARKK